MGTGFRGFSGLRAGLLFLLGLHLLTGCNSRADDLQDRQLRIIRGGIDRSLDQLQQGLSVQVRVHVLVGQKAKMYASIYHFTERGGSFLVDRKPAYPSRRDGGYQLSFDGTKYMQVEASDPFVRLTSRFDKTDAGDFNSNNPLTYMFQFLVPRQGFVTYENMADPNGWSVFVKKIKNITTDDLGNLVVTTQEPEGWQQIVTFSAAHHDYPAKIILRFGTTDTTISVNQWLHSSKGGILDLPGRITMSFIANGTKVVPELLEIDRITALKPDAVMDFALHLDLKNYVEDLDLFDAADRSFTPIISPWPKATYRPADYDLTLRDLSGRNHALAEFRGKTILLNFWATWCGACMMEMPSLVQLSERMKTNPHIVVLCVSTEDLATIRKKATIGGLSAPLYSAAGKPIPSAYGEAGHALPTSYVIDPAGRIVFEYVGGADWSHRNMDAFLAGLGLKTPAAGL